ncbi:MAG: hypothetical protein J5903_01120, partial [Clostridia bacterium]|nr:hypothetical protein [Clostridia bacterium]
IIVVYCFSCIYNGNDYEIKSVKEENGELNIEIGHIVPYDPSGEAIGYTSAPIYRVIVLQIPAREYANIIVSTKFV